MEARPAISVVIATYNRAATLRDTIRHLENQDLDTSQFEVIVVDDGSPDATEDVVRERIPRVRFPLRFWRHANSGPGYSQNRGIRDARAPLVLLIADDIFLQPGALREHLAHHERCPEPEVAVLGRVLQSPALNQSLFLRTWDPFRFRDLESLKELPYYMFWACHVSFKRDFMLQQGMFQEPMGRAGAAAHEDVELGYRLHQHGLRLQYNPDCLGYHYHLDILEGALTRAYQRGLNWDDFKEHVPTPEITVKYHVLRLSTVSDHLRAWTGPGRHYLMGADRSFIRLSMLYAVRLLGFNRWTVKYLWLPFLRSAERSKLLARFVHRSMYRGVIAHYFFKGCHDGAKTYRQPGAVKSELVARHG
jgi:glycosyltransferase involved in cell wall biosynthesis